MPPGLHHRVRGGGLLDLLAGDLPRPLHHPGEGAVETLRLSCDLLKHLLGEVQALLALVRLAAVVVRHGPLHTPGYAGRSYGTMGSLSHSHTDFLGGSAGGSAPLVTV